MPRAGSYSRPRRFKDDPASIFGYQKLAIIFTHDSAPQLHLPKLALVYWCVGHAATANKPLEVLG
jgi:hypothetical protein